MFISKFQAAQTKLALVYIFHNVLFACCVVSFVFTTGIKKRCHTDVASFHSAYFHLVSPNATKYKLTP